MTEPRDLTAYERQILANVAEYGCHVTYVFDPDGDEVAFAYSTGFPETLGQGEVITFGLSREVMHAMVNETMNQCREGLELDDNLRISGLLEGFDVVAKTLEPANIQPRNLHSSMWFHERRFGTELTRAYQLVWPGAVDGLFPWDAGCGDSVIALQPPLYRTSLHS